MEGQFIFKNQRNGLLRGLRRERDKARVAGGGGSVKIKKYVIIISHGKFKMSPCLFLKFHTSSFAQFPPVNLLPSLSGGRM